ncbi:SDR family oxidoreductase [Vulgatibacter sp.]|uniref:SDR family oxidoreductase n=1 Tax=Vulgatibacter sp. TaxID=1971226 RepID=UPI0035681CA1
METLRGRVVVIAGASSGIGRATARLLGAAGARVVLAARREELLRTAAREVEAAGGEALVVCTDLTDPAQLDHLVAAAIERFGGIDAWIANAGVTVYGPFERIPADEFRRVVEVDFFAHVESARRVLPHFRARGGGRLVFVGSVASEAAAPLISPYVASTRALLGFAQSLREELHLEGAPIHVTTILPGSVDTPFFAHARSHLDGDLPRPIPPILPVDRVARAVVSVLAASSPPSRRFVGNTGRLLALLSWSLPTTYVRMFSRFLGRVQRTRSTPLPPTNGSLFQPTPVGSGARGGWLRKLKRNPLRLLLPARS